MKPWRKKSVKTVGPSPINASLYATRHLPVGRLLRWMAGLGGVVAAFVVLSGVGLVTLYQIPAASGWLEGLRWLPIPAARVDEQFVSIRAFLRCKNGWRAVYQDRDVLDGLGDARVHDRVMDRMIQDVLVLRVLRSERRSVSVTDVDEAWAVFRAPYGSEEDFQRALIHPFGSADAFRACVVEPLARLQTAERVVLDSVALQEPVRVMAEALYQDVRLVPDRFADVALRTDTAVQDADELRPLTDYPVDARAALEQTPVGAVTSVQTLPDRFSVFHILQRTQETDGVHVWARELSVPKRDVFAVLEEARDRARITIYLPK